MRSPAHTYVNSKSVLEKYSNNLADKFNTETKKPLGLKGLDPKHSVSVSRLPNINLPNFKKALTSQNSKNKANLETLFGIKKNMLDKSLERIDTDPINSK